MKRLRPSVGILLLLLSLTSVSANTLVQFRTTVGDLVVELYDTDKPVTVQNFLRYVQGGYYTNMFFHRVETNFVIQGGGFTILERGTTNAEVGPVTNFAPIINEFGVGKFYSNVYGTIAMAKTGDPNSATSQFFFNLADNSRSLDNPLNAGGFTVFGRVILGTNVLNEFRLGAANQVVKVVPVFIPPYPFSTFLELPALYAADPNNLTFDDLIYADLRTAPAYRALKTTYTGLFQVPTNVAAASWGAISIATTAGTKFTGSLRLNGAKYAFTGLFDSAGYAMVTATAPKREPLVVRLLPDLVVGTEKLVGSISSSQWMVEMEAVRTPFDARSNPANSYLGKYTLSLPGSGQSNAPAGYGFATVTVNAAGQASVKGALADGTALSQTVSLCGDGRFALYAPLYANSGFLAGWIDYTNASGAELSGDLVWSKPTTTKGLYPAGFVAAIGGVGGRFQAPAPGTSLLGATNAFIFGGDSSTATFTNTLAMKSPNKLLNVSVNKLTVALSASTGLFSGSVKPPGSTRSLSFKGVLWQNAGYGYVLDGGQSAWVQVQPQD